MSELVKNQSSRIIKLQEVLLFLEATIILFFLTKIHIFSYLTSSYFIVLQ